MSAEGPILEVKNLVKDYPGLRAVDGVSFQVKPGTCFALLGPNGAGKTTTIEMIEDITSATSGEILYKGRQRDKGFKQEVGIQLQSTELLQYLTVGETLQVFHKLYDRRAAYQDVVKLCRLEDIVDRDNRKISGGQRQRLLLALALINDPELVFLDEPTTGMDPQARRHLWDIVTRIKERGSTVVLTTHYMEEAELLSDEVAIMDKGQILVHGTTTDLLREHCSGVLVSLPESIPALKLQGLPFESWTERGRHVLLVTDPEPCLKELMSRQIDLSEVAVRHRNLEDLFLQLTGRSLRE